MSEPLTTSRQRYLFIDLYRSAVILLMLEGHVFRTFLPAEVQQTTIFQFHEFFHGLTAPAFLFGAGLTFIISTRKRWVEFHHWGMPLARRIRRLFLVLALGLMIQLPYYSIRKIIIDATLTDYLRLYQFNVLHCISIGLLTLHAIVFFFRKESRFYRLVLSTIVAVCFLTPFIWDIDFLRYAPPAIAQMFNGKYGSPFPLFPYVGFLFAGVIVSWEFLIASGNKREGQFMKRIVVLGVAAILAGIVFDLFPKWMYPTYNYWFTSPNYFFIRIGAILIITAAFWQLALWIHLPTKLLTVLGVESLFVYVLHLVILYGSAVNPETNLQSVLGPNLTLMQTIGTFFIFLIGILLIALLWNYLKEKHFHLYRLVQLATSGVFLYYFFTRDF
ncbi:MAG: DUF1624 domain-containing protein [Ignavibacteria bacterium]|nr:DUF1624 domain-containing protein [Ignavibacteria bacterium]